MDLELVLENSNSAAVHALLNTIIYLKATKDLNSRQTDLLNGPGTLDNGAKDWELNAVL